MKMLRARKQFCRCRFQGHGDKCILTKELQSIPMTRPEEKLEVIKEIDEGLEEYKGDE